MNIFFFFLRRRKPSEYSHGSPGMSEAKVSVPVLFLLQPGAPLTH